MSVTLPSSIKFIVTDFDGVVTDNCVYVNPNGEMSRKINYKDMLQRLASLPSLPVELLW